MNMNMIRIFRNALLGAGLLLLLTRMPADAQQAARVALVIGNGAYPAVADNVNYFRRLTSPVNDADKMEETLHAYGFEVTKLTDASYTEMEQAVNAFVRKLPEGSVGLFFFSGHGVQVQNENYLIPVGRNFADSVDVQEYAINATWVLKKLQNSQAHVKVMLLDACREAMPDLSDDDKEKKGFEGRGLKKMNASGVFIGYAASPGEISLGESGGYGLLTNAFDAAMREFPQLPIEMVFKKAANAVYEATKQRRTPQQPWSEGIMRGEFCFDAENRCLTASATPPPEPTPELRPTIEPTATPTRTSSCWENATPGATCAEPTTGMEFVYVPGGCFQMGQTETEKTQLIQEVGKEGYEKYYQDELPRHEVCLQGFWMGKYEVTNAQYRRFKSNHDSQSYEGKSLNGDDQPVVMVSWNDAQALTDWLTKQGRGEFRLPTEAEWEYAARGGTEKIRYWGDDPKHAQACQYANVHDRTSKQAFSGLTRQGHDCNDGYAVTAPVGQFEPNAFGLYDMHGNVWEWCQDTYHENYKGAPNDGSIWGNLGDGKEKLLRGGSWYTPPSNVRGASRGRYAPDNRSYHLGIRVVRLR